MLSNHGFCRILNMCFTYCIVLTALALTGCASIEGAATNFAFGLVEDRVVPTAMKADDVDMLCSMGQSVTPLISSAGTAFHGDPELLEALLLTAASICSDRAAVEQELRSIRALRRQDSEAAQDARISQKRYMELSARRQYAAHLKMVSRLEETLSFKYGQSCPRFTRDYEELAYMLGTVAGLLALTNDIGAQQAVGVSTDIPPKAERAFICLSNKKWWYVPQAARAVIWSLIPGMDEGKDVWGTLDNAMSVGDKQGIRLSYLLYAMAAEAKSDEVKLRYVLKRYANLKNFRSNPDFRLVDEIGVLLIQHISDRYWTRNVGTRTPVGSYGTFWDEKASMPSEIDVDDLLK